LLVISHYRTLIALNELWYPTLILKKSLSIVFLLR